MNTTAKYRAALGVLAVAALFAPSRPIQSAAGREASPTRPEAADANASPVYGVTIPVGFRHWELIAPSQEAGSLNELRGETWKRRRDESVSERFVPVSRRHGPRKGCLEACSVRGV
jgi:hypothetical protein